MKNISKLILSEYEVSDLFLKILIVLIGMLFIYLAKKDSAWLLESKKSYLWVKLFGRQGARVFYAILGAFLALYTIFYL